jgi:hypothetical protein
MNANSNAYGDPGTKYVVIITTSTFLAAASSPKMDMAEPATLVDNVAYSVSLRPEQRTKEDPTNAQDAGSSPLSA